MTKFGYLFHHRADGDYQQQVFTLEDIEDGQAREYIESMKLDGYTLMARRAYTGLKDREGNEIYNGDVLRVPDLYETPENTERTYHNITITYSHGAFWFGADPMCYDEEYINDECEVIGNRWDTPEGRTTP